MTLVLTEGHHNKLLGTKLWKCQIQQRLSSYKVWNISPLQSLRKEVLLFMARWFGGCTNTHLLGIFYAWSYFFSCFVPNNLVSSSVEIKQSTYIHISIHRTAEVSLPLYAQKQDDCWLATVPLVIYFILFFYFLLDHQTTAYLFLLVLLNFSWLRIVRILSCGIRIAGSKPYSVYISSLLSFFSFFSLSFFHEKNKP